MSDPTLDTYRYLRLAVVGLSLLLAISLVLEIGWGETTEIDSISAFYYSPVRSIFVGSLVAIGLALIAITAQPGHEDVMLNLAGMLAPLIAFVPTPLPTALAVCADGAKRCVPDEFVPSIENNVTAFVIVVGLGLLVAWLLGRSSGTARLGLVTAVAVWAGFTLWFLFGRTSYLVGAHYASAVPFFGLVAGVAWLHANRSPDRMQVPGLRRLRYRSAYKTIAAAMTLTIAAAGALFALDTWADVSLPEAWIFVVETVVLVLFVGFWLFQTAEYWKGGVIESE